MRIFRKRKLSGTLPVPPGQEGRICASKRISRSFLSGADRVVGRIPQNSLEIDPPPPRSVRRLRDIFSMSLVPLLARRGQTLSTALMLVLMCAFAAIPATAQTPEAKIWTGVFTNEQAERGKANFNIA